MKKTIIITVLSVVQGLVVAAPRLQCDQPVFDFGKVPNTETVDHSFQIRNKGDSPLVITKVKGCCGAVALAKERTIYPGQSTEIKVKASLLGRRGSQVKKITLESNDPVAPVVELRLTGTAVSAVYTNPSRIDFGRVAPGGRVSQMVEVLAELKVPVKLIRTESTEIRFRVEKLPPSLEGHPRVRVVFKANSIPGPAKGFIRLHTNHPDYAMLSLPVFAHIGGDISVLPAEIILKPEEIASTKPVMKIVFVRSFTKNPFRVLKAEIPTADISVKISSLGEKGYRVSWMSPKVDASWVGKKLMITVEQDGRQTILNVPIKAGS